MNVLLYAPSKDADLIEVSDSQTDLDQIKTIQNMVGGEFTAVRLESDRATYLLVMDADGETKRKPFNMYSPGLAQTFVGNILVFKKDGKKW